MIHGFILSSKKEAKKVSFFLRKNFFENPPTPLPLKGLHLSLYPLSSGEGKNSGLQKPQTFAGFGIAGRRDGGFMYDV